MFQVDFTKEFHNFFWAPINQEDWRAEDTQIPSGFS